MTLPPDVFAEAARYATSKSFASALRALEGDDNELASHVLAFLTVRGWVQTIEGDPASWVQVRTTAAHTAAAAMLGIPPACPKVTT